MTTTQRKVTALLALLGLGAGGLAAWGPIRQDPTYHDFADARTVLGIPRCLDVVSNAAFLFVGLAGLAALRRSGPVRGSDRAAWTTFFVGVAATAIGSAWYHLDPTDERLVLDRLPMAVAFTAAVASLVSERVDAVAGRRLLAPLVAAGAASVAWWRIGDGDLRLYAFVQYGALLAAVALLAMFRAPRGATRDWAVALVLNALAKVLEARDREIFAATSGTVSGHTLKHLAAAAGCAALVRHVARRQRSGD